VNVPVATPSSLSVSALLLGQVKAEVDRRFPKVGVGAIAQTVESLLTVRFGPTATGQALQYTRRLLDALDTPVTRILVAAWRGWEPIVALATAPDPESRSGAVVLHHHETEARWELAPRFRGEELSGPRLLVSLTLGIDEGRVEVADGRIVALEAARIRYVGSLRLKEAPEELATVGPGDVGLPGGRITFGEGWVVRGD
jgi:hypothetical protein